MMCLFLRLFKVKIFPNVVIHIKNAILEGALTPQMLFQRSEEPTGLQSA
jgi:hypothetical protein